MKAAKQYGVKRVEIGTLKIEFDSKEPITENNNSIDEITKPSTYKEIIFDDSVDVSELSDEDRQLRMIADSTRWEEELLHDKTEEKAHVLSASQAF